LRGVRRLRPNERQLALAYGISRISQGFCNVLSLKIWKRCNNFGYRHAVRDHPDDCGDRNSQVANARNSAHAGQPRCA
jgi:hypothetical protein